MFCENCKAIVAWNFCSTCGRKAGPKPWDVRCPRCGIGWAAPPKVYCAKCGWKLDEPYTPPPSWLRSLVDRLIKSFNPDYGQD